ncbi:YIP1 family protein [Deinococcus yavapaiensis]|uniref:Yip1-like protein n=1 Tax=Deinococcus yavapaiensis KR-236 TaxID=694435 RepID=A0A318S783_9DEIO|nr:YIP1 family protein [Deinococcus yavapaiensis]PYE53557.1 hypothetical protein DES52_10886 [Deinococcus yavapaiensis KR-236]
MTQPLKASLGTMMQQSAYVLARPSVDSFERFERSGGAPQAFTYVAVVALVAGVFALLFNLGNAPFWAFLERSLVLVAGFATFAGVAYAFGRTQGGTGTFNEVAYTLSLSYVPIALLVTAGTIVLTIIPILGWVLIPVWLLLGWVAQAFYAYVGLQGSLNLRGSSNVVIVMAVSALAAWFVQLIVGWIL